MFSLKVREWRTFLFLFKNYFLSKCSVEHPDSIFDEHAKHFRKKLDEYLQMKYKNDEKNVYFTKKLVKASVCTLKVRLLQPCLNLSAWCPEKFRSRCGSRKKNSFSYLKKNVSHQNVPEDSYHFNNQTERFPSNVHLFFFIVRKW